MTFYFKSGGQYWNNLYEYTSYKSTSETKLTQLNVFGMSIGILMKTLLCIDLIHNSVKTSLCLYMFW